MSHLNKYFVAQHPARMARAELKAAGQLPALPACHTAEPPCASAPDAAAPGPAPGEAAPGGPEGPEVFDVGFRVSAPSVAAWQRLGAERDAARLRARRLGQEKARLLASLARLRKHYSLVRALPRDETLNPIPRAQEGAAAGQPVCACASTTPWCGLVLPKPCTFIASHEQAHVLWTLTLAGALRRSMSPPLRSCAASTRRACASAHCWRCSATGLPRLLMTRYLHIMADVHTVYQPMLLCRLWHKWVTAFEPRKRACKMQRCAAAPGVQKLCGT